MSEALAESDIGTAEMNMSGPGTLEPPLEQRQELQVLSRATTDALGEVISPKQDKETKSLAQKEKLPAAEPSGDNNFEEGMEVLYWSKSSKEWFRTVIMGKHHLKGKTFYDLICKKGARASSMLPLTDTLRMSNGEALLVKSSAVGDSNGKHVSEQTTPSLEKKQAFLLKQMKQQLQQLQEDLQAVEANQAEHEVQTTQATTRPKALASNLSDGGEVTSAGNSGIVAVHDQKQVTSTKLIDCKKRLACESTEPGCLSGGGNLLKRTGQVAHSRMNLPRFEVGHKVRYWSKNSGRWLKAVVVALNSEGRRNFYDLNCKRCVHARRLRPYVAAHARNAAKGADFIIAKAMCSPEQRRCRLSHAGNNSFLGGKWMPLTGEQLADWKFAQRAAKRRMPPASSAWLGNHLRKIPRVGSQPGSHSVADGEFIETELHTVGKPCKDDHAIVTEAAEADDARKDAAEKTVLALQKTECRLRRKAAKAARDKIELLLEGHTEELSAAEADDDHVAEADDDDAAEADDDDAAEADDDEAYHASGPVNCLFPSLVRR